MGRDMPFSTFPFGSHTGILAHGRYPRGEGGGGGLGVHGNIKALQQVQSETHRYVHWDGR